MFLWQLQKTGVTPCNANWATCNDLCHRSLGKLATSGWGRPDSQRKTLALKKKSALRVAPIFPKSRTGFYFVQRCALACVASCRGTLLHPAILQLNVVALQVAGKIARCNGAHTWYCSNPTPFRYVRGKTLSSGMTYRQFASRAIAHRFLTEIVFSKIAAAARLSLYGSNHLHPTYHCLQSHSHHPHSIINIHPNIMSIFRKSSRNPVPRRGVIPKIWPILCPTSHTPPASVPLRLRLSSTLFDLTKG